ncbi:heat shock protein transcriptional repressor HspR [Poseidonibacter ostreae]|jgi:MerR family transcriptional regulator, heat shock protein HspR|uniref:MerR family transcriptional regulator n=1 Tax=Poseidonibacter ostreae TaxID=2654171 RepID=A0A6L4WQ44_9BACT|nr:helix-turn-helix transcriptional regulator [Poseidonibacter ostreae]KAB7886226.1 MerR family transcriptional regulator [Poseidonibacter ostreae]KAB7886935.1 MerR family transcriptional regulator [Poseidonibacter ostreae]KAB7892228.1 MerR family transcriptional regulator [Poseidonibacter ostreae]MAC83760.1 MerR family transcriptional regulator [Arcobacter sp.]|tara:strand:- start:2124 stop:2516 length:393 start_codon:yes stop_codon:yes gene_type:complete
METNSYVEPVFLISAVAEILDIHPQTLRQYEREGLITPSRTNGKIRLYSQKDIDHIKYVLTLTRKLGVNLAGVDVILQLNERIASLEEEIHAYKVKIKNINNLAVVPDTKALVVQQTSFDIVIVEKNEED